MDEERKLRALVIAQQYQIAHHTKAIPDNPSKCSSCGSLAESKCKRCLRGNEYEVTIPHLGPGMKTALY